MVNDTTAHPDPCGGPDRSEILFRPSGSPDTVPLAELYGRLSSRTKHLRFGKACPSAMPQHSVRTWLRRYHRPPITCSLVAECRGSLIAEATYALDADRTAAEIAVVVEDQFQNRGVGRKMLTLLAWVAWLEGVHVFEGEVLLGNRPVLHLLRSAGRPVSFARENHVLRFNLDLDRREAGLKTVGWM